MYVLELAGEDDRFAVAEAGSAASGVERLAPGLAVSESVRPDRVRGLAVTRWASELVGRTGAGVEDARTLLESTPTERTGSVAVRARDVRGTAGIDTQEVERELGQVLVSHGFDVDLDAPDHELRVCYSRDTCVLGWLVVEAERGFGARAPTKKPFFQPGSMDPAEARAVVNLAGAASGTIVLDPMCGTGGVLVEAGLVGAETIGFDAQRKMVGGARRNLARYLDGRVAVAMADAGRLPLVEDAVDAVVFDAPYGRQSRVSAADPASLVEAALAEARRVAARAVVVADRSLASDAVAAGWAVEAVFPRRVHRSLTRYVHVLRGDG